MKGNDIMKIYWVIFVTYKKTNWFFGNCFTSYENAIKAIKNYPHLSQFKSWGLTSVGIMPIPYEKRTIIPHDYKLHTFIGE